MKMKYSQEYIEYVKKYPFIVIANYLNGIKDEIVFTSKHDALSFIEREEIKHKRAKFKLVAQTLNPEHL